MPVCQNDCQQESLTQLITRYPMQLPIVIFLEKPVAKYWLWLGQNLLEPKCGFCFARRGKKCR